uniref:DUF4218 domain-containing protein n=1 Tax=Clytia hemisphaerica TaxID=252671 RepID=A0A7M5XLL3_9CNID
MLELRQRRTLVFFFDVIARIHARRFDDEALTTLEDDMVVALALLERDCTIHLSNITTHILVHLASKIRDNGPLYAFWMFAFERMNSWITRRVMNRSKMEECVMETVQILDWVLFCQFMGKFDHLYDRNNTLCSLSNSMLQRDGLIENVDRGKEFSLSCEEKSFFNTTEVKGKRYKKFEPVVEKIEDQVEFKVGEFCYCEAKASFVRIVDLVQIGNQHYAKISVFEEVTRDYETGLWYGKNNPGSEHSVLLEDVSRPMVIAIEDDFIWFIGFEQEKEYLWFESHVKL